MIFFRADANPTICTGHIMRCCSIAAALQKQGEDCAFVTADHQADNLLDSRGMRHFCLDTNWQDMEGELPSFLPLLEQHRPALVIVDSYYVTKKYLRTLRQKAKILYIDDLNAFTYPVDILLNYNLYAETMDYRQRYRNTKTELWLGPSYAPLREEFQNLPPRAVREQVKNVLISTGGADPAGVGSAIMQELLCQGAAEHDITWHFIVGALNPNRDKMRELAEKSTQIVLHENVARMSELMLLCDVAVSAAGSTLYELCACGTPTVTYAFADNQLPGAEEFANQGLMLYAGDIRKNPLAIKRILELLQKLRAGVDLREKQSRAMQGAVDGKGAARIAKTILVRTNSIDTP